MSMSDDILLLLATWNRDGITQARSPIVHTHASPFDKLEIKLGAFTWHRLVPVAANPER